MGRYYKFKMTRTIIPFIFLFLFIFNCKSQSIGDYHQGGVVFYLDSSGGGLTVDIVDIPNPNPMVNTSLDSLLSRWGNYSTHVPGTSSPSIGSGIINSQNFISLYNSGNFAVHQCVNSYNQGFNDWYLPSKNELEEIFTHRVLIDSVALNNGGHLFDDFAPLYPYWSSTESPSTTDFRYSYAVYSSNFTVLRGKILEYKVRAVRSFTVNTEIKPVINNREKQIIKIVNMMGQECQKKTQYNSTLQLRRWFYREKNVCQIIILIQNKSWP
jgi:hypothetical protein